MKSGVPLVESRPGPSVVDTRPDIIGIGDPVAELAARLGPPAETYDAEYRTLKRQLAREQSTVGPAAPLVLANSARHLYVQARKIVADGTMSPRAKCSLLFHTFDAILLTYKSLSLVYCDSEGARSVYGYSDGPLKTLLSRVEAMTRQVAVCVHDAYSLSLINSVIASVGQRLSQVRNEQDMLSFFRTVSGGDDSGNTTTTTTSTIVNSTGGGTANRLPRGIERHRNPYPEVISLLQRIYGVQNAPLYIKDLYECMFLLAKSNAPATLSSALETRLADKDRNIVLFNSPGDRLFATTVCASAIAFLSKTLRDQNGHVETYRVNMGRIFSKYRGESERNFDTMMEWIKNRVRASDRFRVFWFPDIENLMSPRVSNDQEHIATIKNSMLQHMDTFNKDRTLRSFLLLFNSSEGPLDDAFSRRLETVIKTPTEPLFDKSVAVQAICAELTRYRVNLTDEMLSRVAGAVSSRPDNGSSRIGGFAQVQATIRDMYVTQKLALKHDARAVRTELLPPDAWYIIFGRYSLSSSSADEAYVLYDLNERPVDLVEVDAIAYGPSATRLHALIGHYNSVPVKYNAVVQGDPKDMDARTASRTVFFHDG